MLTSFVPNTHPLLVHFPIALLATAAILDVARMALGRSSSVPTVTGLYMAGTMFLVVTYFSGRQAADTVHITGMAHGTIVEHWTLAAWCVGYFVTLTVARLVMRSKLCRPQRSINTGFVLAGLFGLVLLMTTADRGGQLVYRYGVGVVKTSDSP